MITSIQEERKIAEELGNSHTGTSLETPLHQDAFLLSDEQKIEEIQEYMKKIMYTLGLDLTDDSLKGTPYRIAKMYVKEIFAGLHPQKKPEIKVFENKYKYQEMLVEKRISYHSFCEHHFLPIIGKAHVGYISNGKVIGLSKINRIVKYYSQRPQVQERMTLQIANEIKNALNTEDVAVVTEGQHLCVVTRGIEDDSSSTVTAEYSGQFKELNVRDEFLRYITQDLM